MFLAFSGLLTVFMAVLLGVRGPRWTLWTGWLVALLVLPTWLVKEVGSITLDLRTIAVVMGLGGFLVFSKDRLRYQFALMDIAVLGLLTTLVLSAITSNNMALMTVPELARKWLLPYVVGRVFLSSPRDLSRLLPLVAVLLLLLSALAAWEAGSKINVFCTILAKSFPLLEAGEGYRWGIKRAIGPLVHPIFFGLTLVMMFPFAVFAAQRSLCKQGPWWWCGLPFAVLGAILCTASRGPIIAALITVYFSGAFACKKLRVWLLVLALFGGVGAGVAKEHLKQRIASSVESHTAERWVEIDGRTYAYTGTAHRELLFLAYAKAIRDCPTFGYGGRLRGVPIADHLAQRFSSVDNHYLLFFLKHGWAGLTSFVLVALVAFCYLVRMAWNTDLPHSGMAGSMFGALLGVSLLLMTVWFSPDHGTVWLFFVGLTTCLWTLDAEGAPSQELPRGESLRPEQPVNPFQLVPGHAPSRPLPTSPSPVPSLLSTRTP